MLRYITGGFLILHGLVHLLYFGQSWRVFQLQPGLLWPDGSWVFAKLLGNDPTRVVASFSLVVAAIGLAVGGIAILLGQAWWQPLVIGSLIFSSLLYIAMWNGRIERLSDQGVIGLLINLAILFAVLVFRWPQFAF
jgi:uncharacterized membrane protein YkvI